MASDLLELTEAELLFGAAAALDAPDTQTVTDPESSDAAATLSATEAATATWLMCCGLPTEPFTADEQHALRFGPRPQRECTSCGKPLSSGWKLDRHPIDCPFCNERITAHQHAVMVPRRDDDGRLVFFYPAHQGCAIERSTDKVSTMATYKTVRDLPDCRECGMPYEDHQRPLGSIWMAECCDLPAGLHEPPQYWRPATPFRSLNWPFRLIADSPAYTADQKIAYVEDVAA